MIRRAEVDCSANARLVACHEPVSHYDCGTQIRKECVVGALSSSCDYMDFGRQSSPCRLHPIRLSISKNAEGSEAFWTEAKPERDGRTEGSPEGQGTAAVKGEAGAGRGARQAGRANQTIEPIEVPPNAIWRDDFEEFGPDRWTEADTAWAAPELDLGDGRRLVLDAPDPFPQEEWAVSGVN